MQTGQENKQKNTFKKKKPTKAAGTTITELNP